ncbi:hypothetical protein [Paraburkholderia sp. BL25I1N1]|uniref:hypothetical protein n=1 Tax=Paraburkholderia sp. BL25I1N1 TaxID=1938804 RepID=UPI000D07A0AF|nr:hypothetical protein [Paraburkholderia sp. BL25I1N1]PRX92087.1 hypothetical protein B0G73_13649 [Paraburkholderia sp. BL25I1N1]
MARLDDLGEELERLGKEIEDEMLSDRTGRPSSTGSSCDAPVRIQLDIPRDARRRWHISVSMQLHDEGEQA